MYSWTATATNAFGVDTDVAVTLKLIPEPASLFLAGLAFAGFWGVCGVGRANNFSEFPRDISPASRPLNTGGVVTAINWGLQNEPQGGSPAVFLARTGR